jgi:hypothetical protein
MKKTKIDLSFLDKKDFGKYEPELIKTDLDGLFHILVAIGKKFDPNFEVKTHDDIKHYQNVLFYFTDNPKCDWSLSKGILLHGKKGLGKSLTFKIIKEMYMNRHSIPFPMQPKKSFQIVAMESLSIKTNKELKHLSDFYNKTDKSLCLDEIMRESANETRTINNFGTIEKPLSTALHQMYRSFTQKGVLHHGTTNYWNTGNEENGTLFGKIYGNEIQNRCIEMFNLVELTGESKRR